MKHLPDEAWSDFKNRYISDDVFDIAQGLVTTLIIVVPKAKINAFTNSPKYEKLRTDYCNLVRGYTDVKVSKPENIVINILSKEEFDTKYQGSWYNTFR